VDCGYARIENAAQRASTVADGQRRKPFSFPFEATTMVIASAPQ
jgi:hypothetical protein